MTRNSDRTYQVGIVGSYGGLNLGDEAILQGITTQLQASLPVEITVFSRDAEDTLKRHQVQRAIATRNMSRDEVLPEIERLDLLILGGGGILFDGEVKTFMREVMLAHEKGIPVMVYAVSAGPLQDPANQKLVRNGLNQAAAITVRERRAQHLLEEIGVEREIIVTADPALLLEPEPLPQGALEKEHMADDRRMVGLSVREPGPAAPDMDVERYHALLANAADYVVERFETDVVFVPMERTTQDVQHAHAVVSRMQKPKRASVLRGDYTSGQLLSLVGHFDFAIGMRLHFLIFANLQRVPSVALPYGSKVEGFLDDMGMQAPPMQEVSVGQLLAYIDSLWDRRRELRDRIDQALPEMQRRARETNRIAVDILTGNLNREPIRKEPAA